MILNRLVALFFPILLLIGCSSVRLGPNKFPEYPVEIRLYYDSRCEAEVVVDGSNTLTYLGVLGAGGVAMSDDYQHIDDRSIFYNCIPTKLNNSAKAPWNWLTIRIFIDRFMDDEQLVQYVTE